MLRWRFNLVHVVSCWSSRHLCFLVDAADPVQRHASARQSRLSTSRSANSVSTESSKFWKSKIRVIFSSPIRLFSALACQPVILGFLEIAGLRPVSTDFRINMKILRCVNKTETDKISAVSQRALEPPIKILSFLSGRFFFMKIKCDLVLTFWVNFKTAIRRKRNVRARVVTRCVSYPRE